MKPAAPPPAAPSAQAAPPRRFVSWMLLWAGLAAGWVGFLGAITWRTANPPVVNWMQIAQADEIFVGRWENREAGRFHVAEELKQGRLHGEVTVTGLPRRGPPTDDPWVIPVTRLGANYAVTQGKFAVQPPLAPDQPPAEPWDVHVAPQCYPATDDVRRQIEHELTRLKSKQPR